MTHPSFLIGDVEVTPLCDGWAPLPLRDECPGQQVDWNAERGRFPWAFTGGDHWAWHVHAFAIRWPDALVLVDTGIGVLGTPTYDVTGRLEAELGTAGLSAADIRHVLHTHLHADHAGGAMQPNGEPRFPNAIHHVHPADWSFFAGADDPEDFNGRAAMGRLEAAGMLDLRPDDGDVVPGISMVHTPGHTPGHRSVVLSVGEETLMFTGDLLHVPPQVAHPGWLSNHDEDATAACASRVSLLRRAREGSWTVAVSHFAEPFGQVGASGWEGARPEHQGSPGP
jgi:glyoxylase-like metal-dependent hydrolase (beta-lactamase superfamily II)